MSGIAGQARNDEACIRNDKAGEFLSPRLRAVLESAGKCRILADIGTDHAYLPIEAVRAGFCEAAIACDILLGPLKSAENNIRKAGLCEKIAMRLGDGLAPILPHEADCISITGMGGRNIMGILAAAFEKIGTAKLVLSPQHEVEELRRFLHENLYNIIEEKIVREITKGRTRFYVILVAQAVAFADEILPYSDAEYFRGKFFCPEFFAEEHAKISRYIGAISDETARQIAEKRLGWLEEVL